MKDTIYRADAIEAIQDAYENDAIYKVISEDIINALSALPSAEAVQVVRCKDCKYRETDDCPMYWMEWLIIDEVVHDYTTDNGYCHCGKRKGGDDE